MIRSIIIANLSGVINFTHYFEPLPFQFRTNFEREIVEKCLWQKGKNVICDQSNLVAIKQEKILLLLVVADPSCCESNVTDFLHKFADILTKHLKIVTEKQAILNKEWIRDILEEMVHHGNIYETRPSHLTSLINYNLQNSEN